MRALTTLEEAIDEEEKPKKQVAKLQWMELEKTSCGSVGALLKKKTIEKREIMRAKEEECKRHRKKGGAVAKGKEGPDIRIGLVVVEHLAANLVPHARRMGFGNYLYGERTNFGGNAKEIAGNS